MVKRNEKGQFVYINGKGRYKRKLVNGKNLQYSRYVWEQHFGKISKRMIVHHINGNKMDNDINNLALLTYKAHNLLHSKDKKVWNKGLTIKNNKKWAETIKKIHITRSKTFLKKFKETWELRQSGLKLREIAEKLNISRGWVSLRLKRYKEINLQEELKREEFRQRKVFKT